MPIPDFQSLMLPMLKLAADGQEHRLRDVIELLSQQYALSEAERNEMLPSGGTAEIRVKTGSKRFRVRTSATPTQFSRPHSVCRVRCP
ncbi:MAG: hypothetical protein EI684_10950 [Candidatus Viridilinea halotolerans]|uniref:Restriction system protein Mrr-like N-terminal domain-containing protein n=1 Tax=Candidatus Viridilinea halotolerans TaxID=2491704 RepID=A0A426TZU7_9CHLR|nr:MAG: hypothetical protein EI684_10950 [Candidatus Viridilinea halotolerans]